jgi:spoIIIJ-associated protein
MLEQKDINKIKEAVEEFFEKMTIAFPIVEASLSLVKSDDKQNQIKEWAEGHLDIVNLDIKLDEPQILIGQQGQTLFEIQRLLRMVLNKKLQKVFYLNLDINDYKKQKIEYLKDLAKELADQVALSKEEKVLLPMSAYERRVIHAELSQRTDIITESQGDGFDRHIVIKPK